eukprot:1249221-Rhodomonas_salina.2
MEMSDQGRVRALFVQLSSQARVAKLTLSRYASCSSSHSALAGLRRSAEVDKLAWPSRRRLWPGAPMMGAVGPGPGSPTSVAGAVEDPLPQSIYECSRACSTVCNSSRVRVACTVTLHPSQEACGRPELSWGKNPLPYPVPGWPRRWPVTRGTVGCCPFAHVQSDGQSVSYVFP